ncbi:right-handed parallel beta-helix repeat-containing protein [Parasediminibacterium sp. JCM 36343]|uniref:right-handed parallel beta-helix repeat-containing protein n=1 Tax=Parasediminibacterium sp. JCM 36343 TaxID=3374279 RepID=UPI003979565C
MMTHKNVMFIFSLLLSASSLLMAQTTWHVSAAGDDANNGKTVATAFRTLQKAADLVKPGDVVLIGNGNYSNANRSSGSAVLYIKSSGTKDAWITWKAEKGEHPEIHPGGWAGIQVGGSYHIIDGITVIGANDSIVLLKAQEDSKNKAADPHFNTNGIFVNGRGHTPDDKPHHVIVRNCTVGKCPGGGIIAIETDYITIEDCKVYENAWYMRYGGSGISTLDNWAFDDAPGYHNIIQRNYCWNNKTMVSWEKIGRLSDGNGIILDVTDQEQNGATNMNNDKVIKPGDSAANAKPKRPEWKGRALVANNVSAFNGGSGIHTFRTKYVDVINNTVYHNGEVVGYPDMFANSSEDIVFLNNIIVPRPGCKVTGNNKNKNIRWDYNIYPIPQDLFNAPNDIVADPQFVNAYFDRLTADFHLKAGSPALSSASNDVPQATDLQGKPRPKGKGRDRGAYEQ